MALLLTERDVESLLTMDVALQAVEASFRALAQASAVNHPRRRLPLRDGTLHYMASVLPGHDAFGLKVYPSTRMGVQFLILLYRYETGRLLALIEGDFLGRMRTGAASGVATRYMARADSKVLGLIGAGGQARTQVQAVCAAVNTIERVLVYSRQPEKRAAFVEAMQGLVSAEVLAVDHPRAAIERADVVVTMTTSSTPVFEGAWLRPGTHINAAGSNHLKRREIDGETVRRASRIAVDMLEQAKMESGDLASAVAEGLITWESVIEFADIVNGKTPGRRSVEEITLFESHGLSAWDIATAARVYDLAMQNGVGRAVEIFQTPITNY